MSRRRPSLGRTWRSLLVAAIACMVAAAVSTAVGAEGTTDALAIAAWASLLAGATLGLVARDR